MPDSYKLSFIISAENKCKAAIDQVKSQMDSIQDKVGALKPVFQKMVAIGTAGFAAISGAIALSIKNYIRAGDEVYKMSIRTGFAVKTLSELRYVADICGTSLEGLETGIKKMSNFITDARNGNERYIETIKKLGGELEDLEGMNPETVFFELARGIAEIPDPMERASIAMDVFGKTGTDLLPMFAEGREGIEKLRKKARELGVVFDEEAAMKAAKLQDAMTDLKTGVVGVQMEIAETFIPKIKELIEKIEPVLIQIREWIEKNPELAEKIGIVGLAITGFVVALGTLGLILPSIIVGIKALGVAFTFLLQHPIILAIAAIIAVIALWVIRWQEFKETILWTWDIIKEETIKIWTAIKEFFLKIWEDITNIFQSAYDKIINIVNKVTAAAQRVKETISGAVSKMTGFFGGFQFGGEIPRTGMYMLHRGEQVVPAGAGVAGGITVNITGGYYLSEWAAEELGNLIIQKLKRTIKL